MKSSKKPKIIAHRGHSQKYPENTLLAFKKALQAKADGVELDVHLTKDKHVIVHHFFYLGHTDNGDGRIFEKNLSYLQSLDAGSWFHDRFANERMPTLEEVFAELGTKFMYHIELKAYGKELLDRILEIGRKYGVLKNVQFTSFLYPMLAYIKRTEPNATVGYLSPPLPDWMDLPVMQEVIKANLFLDEIDVLHSSQYIFTEKFIKEVKNMGIKVHFTTGDTKEEIQSAIDRGADEFTTNSLDLAVAMIKSK